MGASDAEVPVGTTAAATSSCPPCCTAVVPITARTAGIASRCRGGPAGVPVRMHAAGGPDLCTNACRAHGDTGLDMRACPAGPPHGARYTTIQGGPAAAGAAMRDSASQPPNPRPSRTQPSPLMTARRGHRQPHSVSQWNCTKVSLRRLSGIRSLSRSLKVPPGQSLMPNVARSILVPCANSASSEIRMDGN